MGRDRRPFGWPREMAAALHAYATCDRWPGIDKAAFRLRRTDRFVRAGADRVLEAYPAAALLLWGLDRSAYKGGKGRPEEPSTFARETLLAAIEAQAPWLVWEPGARQACVESDDALDAVLCALIARAAARGLTMAPPAADLELARAEGWIHLPRKGSLATLLKGD